MATHLLKVYSVCPCCSGYSAATDSSFAFDYTQAQEAGTEHEESSLGDCMACGGSGVVSTLDHARLDHGGRRLARRQAGTERHGYASLSF